jgi:hypothetical protein
MTPLQTPCSISIQSRRVRSNHVLQTQTRAHERNHTILEVALRLNETD